MTLREIINQIEALPDDLTIYATEADDWQIDSPAALVTEEDSDEIGMNIEDMSYFLEVSIAKEVLDGCRQHKGRSLSEAERLAAVVYYASYDAYNC